MTRREAQTAVDRAREVGYFRDKARGLGEGPLCPGPAYAALVKAFLGPGWQVYFDRIRRPRVRRERKEGR